MRVTGTPEEKVCWMRDRIESLMLAKTKERDEAKPRTHDWIRAESARGELQAELELIDFCFPRSELGRWRPVVWEGAGADGCVLRVFEFNGPGGYQRWQYQIVKGGSEFARGGPHGYATPTDAMDTAESTHGKLD